MMASCGSRKTSPRRPKSPFSSWSFFRILLVVLVFLLPTSTDACGAPPRFESMMLKGHPKDSYQAGDSIEYQCRPGYLRQVPPLPVSSVCQSDDTWKPLQEACTKRQCPQLGDPLNGQVSGTFLFGSVAHYTCNEGYYLVGETTLYCELSADTVDWNADPPNCEKVLCQPPKQIPNGVTNTQKETYEYNEVVIYSCKPSSGADKYSLVGESRLICSGRNVWSSDPPECKVIKCRYPVLPDGELVSGHRTQFYYQDMVEFRCKEGFYLQGNKRVVCTATGDWEQLPQCTKVSTPPSTKAPVTTVPGPVTSNKTTVTSHPGHSTTPSTPPSPDTLGAGAIAAIVISVLALIAIIVGYVLCRHKKKKGKTEVNAEYRPYRDKASTPAEPTH